MEFNHQKDDTPKVIRTLLWACLLSASILILVFVKTCNQ